MNTYETMKKSWTEAADLRSLFANLPEVFRRETLENHKEHYQELQELLREIFRQMNERELSDEENLEEISCYLLSLSKTIPEIDEEAFDHKMNVVKQYRQMLKAFLALYGDELAGFGQAGTPSDRAAAFEKVRESIRLAADSRALLREKYEQYL